MQTLIQTCADRSAPRGADRPVREYVAAMARELAQMARWEGDETLGKLLDGVAEVAERSAG